MNYLDIVKRAWGTTWRYKILWLFGLFAGGASGGSNFNWNTNGGSGSGSGANAGAAAQRFAEQIQHYLPVIIVVGAILLVIGLFFFVMTFAAQGGLIHLVNEAEEKRSVKAGDGWSAGFGRWGRIFLIDFLIGLPVIVLLVIFAAIFGASIVSIIAGSGQGSQSSAATSAILSGVGGMCCGLAFLVIATFAYSIVFGTVNQLALRYAVLEDRTAIESLKQGWSDVWGKRGAIGMYFVMWATALVYSIALSVALIVFAIPLVIMAVAGNIVGAVGVGALAGLLALVPSAAYGAFASSAWTIFFRRMTGREQVAVPIAPAYAGGYPPAPPVPNAGFPAPPAPPTPPATPGVDPWKAAQELPPVPAPEAPPTPPAPPAPPAAPEPPYEGV
jgi:hypothetical protein